MAALGIDCWRRRQNGLMHVLRRSVESAMRMYVFRYITEWQ